MLAVSGSATAIEKWYRVTEVMQITGFGRSFIYSQMEAGNLRSVKCGRGRRIPESAIADFQAKFNTVGEGIKSC